MSDPLAADPDSQGGFASIEWVLATLIGLVMFVLLANVVVNQYARGVVRAAVDEGARQGAREGATVATCDTRAHEVLDDLLGGSLGRQVRLACRLEPGAAVAEATTTLPGWLPGTPDWTFTLRSRQVKEGPPT